MEVKSIISKVDIVKPSEDDAENRHNYSVEEIEQSLGKEVVERLIKLIRFRNEYDAFNGEFKVLDSTNNEVRLSWEKNNIYCKLFIDLNTNKAVIEYINNDGKQIKYNL
ncbi:hypothetical protein [Bacillus sp. USDA818B3_A]|uniref:hypothetical protein n=1 Tax=Bacillus sp. USDA818B3_A TaxID=2698834 RepID=UPI0013708F80|nr:hypothetical protein [Bacillus sp. USDA818B3_A]